MTFSLAPNSKSQLEIHSRSIKGVYQENDTPEERLTPKYGGVHSSKSNTTFSTNPKA